MSASSAGRSQALLNPRRRSRFGRWPRECDMTTHRWNLAVVVLFAGYATTIAWAN